MESKFVYKIQQKICTLAHNAIMDETHNPVGFTINNMSFSHWEFNHYDGWISDAWLVESDIFASNHHDAYKQFRDKLRLIIPRVSLLIQCYIDYLNEPFLIHKIGSNKAFFRYTRVAGAVGLMYAENQNKALVLLIENKEIPEEFYYYWNDMINTIGYSSKLLLIFSAIEALIKKAGKKDWSLLNEILGNELTVELFGTKEKSMYALRNRLVHGEYFDNQDNGKNYLEVIHNKVIDYFNRVVFNENLIAENVTHPQRHFFGNREGCCLFIKSTDGNFTLKSALSDFDNNRIKSASNYLDDYEENSDY